jgi:hypothetical protein
MFQGTTAVQASDEDQHRSPAKSMGTRHRMPPVLTCRATSVPFTTVMPGPQGTTADSTSAPSTCIVGRLRR